MASAAATTLQSKPDAQASAKSVQEYIDELPLWSDGTALKFKPMTGMQWLIWTLAAFGKFFEGFVVFMGGVTMPLITPTTMPSRIPMTTTSEATSKTTGSSWIIGGGPRRAPQGGRRRSWVTSSARGDATGGLLCPLPT